MLLWEGHSLPLRLHAYAAAALLLWEDHSLPLCLHMLLLCCRGRVILSYSACILLCCCCCCAVAVLYHCHSAEEMHANILFSTIYSSYCCRDAPLIIILSCRCRWGEACISLPSPIIVGSGACMHVCCYYGYEYFICYCCGPYWE